MFLIRVASTALLVQFSVCRQPLDVASLFCCLGVVRVVHMLTAGRDRQNCGIVSYFVQVSDKVATLRECKKELEGMIDKTNSHPILIRLAWHDAGERSLWG